MRPTAEPRPRLGLLDHCPGALGGAQLVVAHMAAAFAPRFRTELLHFSPTALAPALQRAFSVDLAGVCERRISRGRDGFGLPGRNGWLAQARANAPALTAPYDLFVYSGHGVPPLCRAGAGLVYCHFPREAAPEVELVEDARWGRRQAADRWLRRRLYDTVWRRRMRGYACVMTNSAYSAEWIRRRWAVRAEVVHPPVALAVPPVAKRNWIISVGRFTDGERSKHQLVQVQAFREFVRRAPGWELLLAGACAGPGDQAYLQAVRDAAAGAPVRFLVSAERPAVLEALAAARMFWHTGGLGVDEARRPELAEHFGIATVEAMRSGCVPVVVASGGQREIVEDGAAGFLVREPAELVERSLLLAGHPGRLAVMAAAARRRSARFGPETFVRRLLELAAARARVPAGVAAA
jgi:glycosyltransferase involved in cell wall biosynthesis